MLKTIDCLDKKEDVNITLLDAVNFIHKAWLKVSEATIKNCFRHAGIQKVGDLFDEEDELPLLEWLHQQERDAQPSIMNDDDPLEISQTDIDNHLAQDPLNLNLPASDHFKNFDLVDFVHIDDDVYTTEVLDDDSIIEQSTANDESVVYESDAGTDGESEVHMSPVVPLAEASKHLQGIRIFLQSRDVPRKVWDGFVDVENYIEDLSVSVFKRQTKITDFFA